MMMIKVTFTVMIMMMISTMSRACGNIGTTFEALKQHSTATTYHEQVLAPCYSALKTRFFKEFFYLKSEEETNI